MTPSNPDNNKPFIYRIADALGITHLVVAVQHSHLMSEIEGLVSALAGKSDTNHTHKSIQYNPSSATDGYAGFSTTGEGSFSVYVQDNKSINFGFGGITKASITKSNAGNLARALQNPDNTPTSDSDNLVTSGGVKAALDGKQDVLTFDSTPTSGSDNPVKSSGIYTALAGKAPLNHTHTPLEVIGLIPAFVSYSGNAIDLDGLITAEEGLARVCVQNETSGHVQFDDLFYSGGDTPIHVNVNGSAHIEATYYAIATIYKIDKNLAPDHEHELCYFLTIDGIFNDGN